MNPLEFKTLFCLSQKSLAYPENATVLESTAPEKQKFIAIYRILITQISDVGELMV